MACTTEKDAVCVATTNDVDSSEQPSMCTMQYEPVCAEKEVQCVTAPCNPIRQTYGNACMAAADQAKVIFEWDCNIAEGGVVVGGDRDEHGCIGSAGYIWSEIDQQCVRPWEEEQNIVSWAYGLWITKFDTIADFNWDTLVTREQAAKMIMATIDVSNVPEWMIKQVDGSCVWTDANMVDSSLLSMVQRSCFKWLFYGSNGKFMPKAYLTDTDALTVMTRASKHIPALAEIIMTSDFAITGKPLTRGELLARLQNLMNSIQQDEPTLESEVDFIKAQKDLDTARTMWDSKKLTTYSLIQTKSCFCMEEYTRPMMYRVVDDLINTATLVYADDGGSKVTIEAQLNTVDQAFDTIQDAIDNKVANLTVEYNPIYGHPVSIAIDVNAMIADEEQYYSYKLITDADVVLWWSYTLDTYNGAKVGNSAITLSFTADRASAKICNGMGANYTATKDTILFWPMMSTMMYCDDAQLMSLESQFGSLSTISYTTTSTSLTMTASGSTWVWKTK